MMFTVVKLLQLTSSFRTFPVAFVIVFFCHIEQIGIIVIIVVINILEAQATEK